MSEHGKAAVEFSIRRAETKAGRSSGPKTNGETRHG